MGNATSPPYTNRLLASLPQGDRVRLLADCNTVDLDFGRVLSKPGEKISYAFFPTDCLVSLLATSERDDDRMEVAMVGNEGMVGGSLALGVQVNSLQAVVQRTGTSLCIPAAGLRTHLEHSPALERAVKRYLHVLMNQMAQSAFCVHFHTLEARLASRLLMAHDRTPGDQLHLTQAFLSSMLGVRRSGISQAAGALQGRGLINYRRGDITVRDRPGLESASCHCYSVNQ